MIRLTIVGIVGVLAAASISVAASWAQPRETRVLPSPVTERLFHLANCTSKELAECTDKCANNDNLCITRCQAYCALKK
jgi:hypothetical protein